MSAAKVWWGDFELLERTSRYWRIGSLDLWVERTHQELRLTYERRNQPCSGVPTVCAAPEHGPSLDASLVRLGSQKSPNLKLRPAMPDRAGVVRPGAPLFVAAGESATFFVSTPVWVQVLAGAGEPNLDIPTARSAETWFGESTREGELCYALATDLTSQVDDLVVAPHVAISPIHVRNRARKRLVLERLRLPLVNVSLFAADGGALWTEEITLDRDEDDEPAAIHIGKGPAPAAENAVLVAPARHPPERGILNRTVGTWLHLKG